MTLTLIFAISASLVGIYLLGKSADWLVHGSSSLAYHFGVTPLVIGLTVVALGTSMPELATSLLGGDVIALGNVAGSNMMNLALVLGITAMIAPIKIRGHFVRFELPVMVLTGPIFIWVAWNGEVSKIEGIIFLVLLAGYIITSIRRGRIKPDPDLTKEAEEFISHRPNIKKAWILVVVGCVGLVLGGQFLVEGAVKLAELVGISQRIIALTLVAGGTSLPELATCVVAARKNEQDLALGNVIGSNIFNILGILGVCAVVSPQAVAVQNKTFDIPAVTIIQILVLLLIIPRKKLFRLEGAILLLGYITFIALLFLIK